MSAHQWADVPGYEGLYKVCSDGRVLSLGRTGIGGCRGGTCIKHWKQKLMTPQSNGVRHRARVGLRDRNLKQTPFYVADLVAHAFGKDVATALPEHLQKRPRRGSA